ncbi:MAG: hypothetical protein JO153_11385 [Solirubrobacterales bacterium]|nr:hypothetical protein [Solirubrobacterales bacterium]
MRSLSTRAAGFIILVLGLWGGLVPFIGPYFHFALGPDKSWTWTSGRFFLSVLPGAVAALGGLILIGAGPRGSARLGALLALAAGIWFAIGPDVSLLWTTSGAQGVAHGSKHVRILEMLAYHSLLGTIIAALGAYAFPRFSASRAAADAGMAAAPTTAYRAPRRAPEVPRVRERPVPPELGREERVREEPVRDEPVRGAPVREQPVGDAPVREEPATVRQEPVRDEVADESRGTTADEPPTASVDEPRGARADAAPAAGAVEPPTAAAAGPRAEAAEEPQAAMPGQAPTVAHGDEAPTVAQSGEAPTVAQSDPATEAATPAPTAATEQEGAPNARRRRSGGLLSPFLRR